MLFSSLLVAITLTPQAAPAPRACAGDALGQAYLLFLQARAQEEGGDLAGAVAGYRKALELCPDAADIHAELAALFGREGQADNALTEGALALQRDPDNRTAHRVLGLMKAELATQSREPATASTLRSEAAGHLERVRADRLADPTVELALGRLYVQSGQYRKAIDVLRAFLLDRPDYVDGLLLLARAQEETGAWTEAAATWGSLSTAQPRNIGYRMRQGNALANSGDFDRAEQTFRGVIAAQPTNAVALNYLGYMLAERGAKLDEAVDLITRALAIDRDNPSYLDSLGWAYVQQARLDRAREPLERAAAALPRTSVIQDHLAELYFRLKLYREAAATWDRALDGDRTGVDVDAITKKRDRAKALAAK